MFECRFCRSDISQFNLIIAKGKNLEQCKRLFILLIALDVLNHDFGFTVLCNDQGLFLLTQLTNDISCMSLEITDWFYL